MLQSCRYVLIGKRGMKSIVLCKDGGFRGAMVISVR